MLIILLLFYLGLNYLDPPIEQGIAINFGSTETGRGETQSTDAILSVPKQNDPEIVETSKSDIKEKVITQKIEDAPVVKEEDKQNLKAPSLVKEETKKEPEKKPDPKPDKETRDALDNLIKGPKMEGADKGEEGDDGKPGDKGDPKGDPNAKSYYGIGKGLDGDGNYLLGGRKALNKEKFIQDCNEAGTVVVSIEVDRTGKVIHATAGVRGTTNNSRCLLDPARRAAMATRFNGDENAPEKQIGKIIYRFTLSQ